MEDKTITVKELAFDTEKPSAAQIEEAMNANLLPLWRNKVKIVYSQLKESDAAILGASALAWEL